jgi:hypothetical protein
MEVHYVDTTDGITGVCRTTQTLDLLASLEVGDRVTLKVPVL